MKIRNGFVSNSSSSSFLIVGIDRSSAFIEELAKMDNVDIEGGGYGVYQGKHFVYYGSYYDADRCQFDYAGLPANEALMEKSGNELRKIFVEQVRKLYKIKIPEEMVDIYYGESSSD